MRTLHIFQVFAIVACVLLAFHATPAFAQSGPPSTPPTQPGQVTPPPKPIDSGALVNGKAHFDSVRQQFLDAAQQWETTLGHYATRLFWLLAFIELVWTSAKLVLRAADLGEITTELVKYILFIGFFAALLMHGAQWATLIVNSFQIAASNAASAGGYNTSGVSPSDIFASGINIAAQIDEKAKWYELGKEVGALVIVLLFAAIAAMIVLAWIETYFVIFASIIFTGFGGSRFTSDYAKRMLMLAVTAGAKLFVLLLVASLLQTMAQHWATAFSAGTDASVLSLLGLCALGAFLCVRIPSLISSISSGQVGSSSGLIAAAASLATAAAGLGVATQGFQEAGKSLFKGAQGAHGAGMAMSAASSLAASQGSGSGGVAGAASHVGRTLGNLGSAAAGQAKSSVQNLGGPLSARSANNGAGNFGSRMADSMIAKKSELTKPSAPAGASAPPPATAGASAEAGSVSGGGAGGGGTATGGDSPSPGPKSGSGDSSSSGAETAPVGSTQNASASGGGTTTGTPTDETQRGEKRSELQDALRHFGNRIKSHKTED